MSRVDRLSPHALATFGGALYLVNIVFGAVAIGIAPSQPALHRLGAAAHVVVDLTNIPLGLIFYELLIGSLASWSRPVRHSRSSR